MEKAAEKLKKIAKKDHPIIKEFKEFINRGSIIDLAVGVVIGSAFTSIVNSLVNDIIMPIVGLVVGGVDFTSLKITIPNFFGADNAAVIAYGNFLQNIVNFLIVALAIFLLVRFINKLHRKKDAKPQKVVDKTSEKQEDEQILILREIRDSLKNKK